MFLKVILLSNLSFKIFLFAPIAPCVKPEKALFKLRRGDARCSPNGSRQKIVKFDYRFGAGQAAGF